MNAMKHMHILLADAKEYKMTQTQFQLFKFQKPEFERPSQSAILVDMDGTLALREGHSTRDPYDWSRAGEDGICPIVADIVDRFSPDHTIIIFTARPESSKLICTNWLKKHNVPFDHIFTRKDKDNREDSIVKWEMFEEYVKPFWTVEFILDDRQRVVDMWRTKGFKVLQVASGDF